MLIKRHDIDAALPDACQTARAVRRVIHSKSLPFQAALNQPCETGVVVNVQKQRCCGFHVLTGGTLMTEKNKPNCRMALAKLS